MPHDRNGNIIKKGDRVLLEAVVEEVYEGEEYCNAQFRIGAPEGSMQGKWDSDHENLTTNTGFCVLVDRAGS